MSKRYRLSGYEYKKQRMQRENKPLAQSMSTLLTRDMRPRTSACA